jgi:hypothetical protein
MPVAARWIRLEPSGLPAMQAACAGFARAQGPEAAPAVLWARVGEGRHAFGIVAGPKHAPGRSLRWRAWALAPLVAAYRQLGLSAYHDADRICLSGQPITEVAARQVGACVVVVADFTAWGADFIDCLRQRIEAQYGWQFDHAWPSGVEAEAIAAEPAGAA